MFCVTCILKWAETRASCPVDRKQFEAVYKVNALEDCIKVQIKQQISKKDDLLSCNEGKHCPMNMKSFARKQENEVTKPLAIFWKNWNQKYSSSDNEDKNAVLVKKNKPRRQTCSNRSFRSNSCNRSFSISSFTGESPNHRNECIEISKIDTIVEHKRRELELSCSVLARVERIPSMCYEMETCLRVPIVVTGTLFPTNTTLLENFGSSIKGYAVTYVQEGEEKKQTSGTAGTRGTRRKISDNTPRRRSARNTKTETTSQPQSSSKSSSSGCEASGDGSSFVNASCAEPEKIPPKRKAKRAVKQQEPLVKKKLRSYGRCKKPTSDLVEEGNSEAEGTVLLDKDHLPDIENSTSDISCKSDVELQSANGLENSKDHVECKELREDSCKGQDTSEMPEVDPCVQEPPLPTPEGETEKCDAADDTDFENERFNINTVEHIVQSAHVPGEEFSNDAVTVTPQLQEFGSSETELPGKVEPVAVADKPLNSSEDKLALGAESVTVADEPLPSPTIELQEKWPCAESEKQLMSDYGNELLGKLESVAVTDGALDRTSNKNPEEPLPGHCVHSASSFPEQTVVGEEQTLGSPSSKLLMSLEMEDPETEERETNALANDEGQKDTGLLMNITSGNKCDQPLEEAREESRMSVLPVVHNEDAKHYNDDNNEIVAMDCDSFSSDQNETRIDQLLVSGIVEQEADSLLQEMEHSANVTSPEKREESECSAELKKDRKTRTRRSRFHSPSTTWSPSKREGRKSQSPSPERVTVAKSRMSRSPRKEAMAQSPKGDTSKEGQRSLPQSPKLDLQRKRKRSVSQSPKRDQQRERRFLSQSPKRDPQREGRSQSQSPKKDLLREERRSFSQSPKSDLLREGKRSPSCSPKRDEFREKRRSSRTRVKDSSPRHKSNTDSTGNESSRFPEHQPYKRKSEQDFSFDTPADRSGWTSASSWAVRKTLPADVQNYYSRRGRNSPTPQSAWTRPEEAAAAPEQDPNFKDQANQQGDNSQLSINIMQPQMNVMTPVNTQHQSMNIFPYPVGIHAPIMNIQHNPFTLPPPVPMHLHAGVPLVQVATPTNVSQGPPPPPPPPPPSQQVNYVASQLDAKQLQAVPSTSHGVSNMGTPILSASTTALGSMEAVQGPSSGNTTSSSNIKSSNSAVKLAESKVSVTVEASADSSKKDQKLLIQEKAAQEVKLAIKPFYQNKDITKEEYKEIVRKAVDKVCHSKSGEVNSAKVANLVKAYVDKYKHSRKKNPEEAISVERK
uniref:Uncharacterized protein n=1 Tax=Sphaerodactylus townsendi TaxID=933632 RepID=A0ACB8FPP5_9SAUR